MKLLTMKRGTTTHPGLLLGDDVLDLGAASEHLAPGEAVPADLKGWLGLGASGSRRLREWQVACDAAPMRTRLRTAGALPAFKDVTLAPVIPDPDLVLCGSMNSRGHLNEMGDAAPAKPVAFQKVRSALCASGDAIVLPPDNAEMVDWEGEFCAVIGTPCHRVSTDEAHAHIGGFTLLNDVSAREFVKGFVTGRTVIDITMGWQLVVAGKNFPTFCPIGPVIATPDEFGDAVDYRLETLVNGEVVQSSTPEDLVFSIAEMVSFYSHFFVLAPGDIVSMGSPPGVGMARKPPRFLKAGDVVQVREPRLGALTNTVAGGR